MHVQQGNNPKAVGPVQCGSQHRPSSCYCSALGTPAFCHFNKLQCLPCWLPEQCSATVNLYVCLDQGTPSQLLDNATVLSFRRILLLQVSLDANGLLKVTHMVPLSGSGGGAGVRIGTSMQPSALAAYTTTQVMPAAVLQICHSTCLVLEAHAVYLRQHTDRCLVKHP
eukprot:GHRR01025366.1.p1 GENE.GHRR01025366.1~~GHRR01025366.1.p1  ORF type:complete len:168 (+),score=40.35 GHRR01025366.1:1083-1586(+)